jgi:hypothetical protein
MRKAIFLNGSEVTGLLLAVWRLSSIGLGILPRDLLAKGGGQVEE